jgi:hypothetical protein
VTTFIDFLDQATKSKCTSIAGKHSAARRSFAGASLEGLMCESAAEENAVLVRGSAATIDVLRFNFSDGPPVGRRSNPQGNGIKTIPTQRWQPVTEAERYVALDALRGLALLGVLLVDLLGDFRISLAEHILTFHTQPGWADRAVDVLAAGLLEFKAFAVFSLLFGVGLAVVAERAAARHVNVDRFLIRRLLVLLAIGLCHLLLIWNGDILSLYAVCGLMLLPLLRLPGAVLATAGTAAVALTFIIPWGFLWPAEDTLRGLASEAARVYPNGSFAEILAFHWWETQRLILPLLAISVPKTWGLMALGAAAWRAGVFREPQRHSVLLWGIVLVGGVFGGLMTALSVYSASTGHPTGIPSLLVEGARTCPWQWPTRPVCCSCCSPPEPHGPPRRSPPLVRWR